MARAARSLLPSDQPLRSLRLACLLTHSRLHASAGRAPAEAAAFPRGSAAAGRGVHQRRRGRAAAAVHAAAAARGGARPASPRGGRGGGAAGFRPRPAGGGHGVHQPRRARRGRGGRRRGRREREGRGARRRRRAGVEGGEHLHAHGALWVERARSGPASAKPVREPAGTSALRGRAHFSSRRRIPRPPCPCPRVRRSTSGSWRTSGRPGGHPSTWWWRPARGGLRPGPGRRRRAQVWRGRCGPRWVRGWGRLPPTEAAASARTLLGRLLARSS